MPVQRVSMRESADYSFSGKASYNQRVFVDVNVIIKIDEIVPQSLTKNEPGDCNQSEADIKGRESPRRALF